MFVKKGIFLTFLDNFCLFILVNRHKNYKSFDFTKIPLSLFKKYLPKMYFYNFKFRFGK